MYIYDHITNIIKIVIKDLFDIEMNVVIERPKNLNCGDCSTNVAMLLVKVLNEPSDRIATQIIDKLLVHTNMFDKILFANPGFINMFIKYEYWHKLLYFILSIGDKYGDSIVGYGKSVNIEFVSANPTGPIHIGNARSAVVGDVLSNIMKKCGFHVVKEYYINDYGNQLNILLNSVIFRYKEIYNVPCEKPVDYYPGDYVLDIATKIKEHYNDSLLNGLSVDIEASVKSFIVELVMESIKEDLSSLGVRHDVFRSEERDIHKSGILEQTIELLNEKKMVYKGFIEKPIAYTKEDVSLVEKEQLIFKATAYGDDIDRVLQKADGSYTYFAPDIAYHLDKIKRGFSILILILGADHIGYVKRITAAVMALSDNTVHINVLMNQMVKIIQNDNSLKMSKREGCIITIPEMIKLLGKDVLRFIMLSRKIDSILEIDIEKSLEQSKDNQVFYVQYASTRAASILRKVEMMNINLNPDKIRYSLLSKKEEINILSLLGYYPNVLKIIASNYDTHKLVNYLYSLATEFHSLWTSRIEDEAYRFVIETNEELTYARCSMVKACLIVFRSALDIMGIECLEFM